MYPIFRKAFKATAKVIPIRTGDFHPESKFVNIRVIADNIMEAVPYAEAYFQVNQNYESFEITSMEELYEVVVGVDTVASYNDGYRCC